MPRRSTSASPKPPTRQHQDEASSGHLLSSLPKHIQVYLYVPNLIGYARVVLAIFGIYSILASFRKDTDFNSWRIGLTAYLVSFVLDFFDGYAARFLNQSSDYGAVLDMMTDRVSTMLLLLLLTHLTPERFEIYASLAALDYSSHWVQMYSAKGHHKASNADKNFIVRAFYGIYPLFGYLCAGTEIYYMVQVVLRFAPSTAIAGVPLSLISTYGLLPACVGKNIVNLAQLFSGFEAVAKR